jgi:16S rRNA (uracil1498-N3)-methyltransferase
MRAAPERMRAHAIEAAEQSWRLSVPEIAPALGLKAALAKWPDAAPILYCDERRSGAPALLALQNATGRKGAAWGILIGPEGGFDAEEQALLSRHEQIIPASLGPRIVRAETAAVMALTLWQSVLGDLAS